MSITRKKKKKATSTGRNVRVEECKINHRYDWLAKDKSDKPLCTSCNTTIAEGNHHIKGHGETDLHEKNYSFAKQTMTIQEALEKNQETVFNLATRKAELKIIMRVVEHNLPLKFLDHEARFDQSSFPDSNIAKRITCGRTKGTQIITTILAPASMEEAAAALQVSKYSIIIDETTDISAKQCLGIVARYFWRKHHEVRNRFLGIMEVADETAQGLFTALINHLSRNNISLSNMIGFASDNAAVMRGQFNGVLKLLRDKLPSLFSLGCICHSFNLCASDAAKTLPKTIEDLARDVNSYFCRSSK